MNSAYNQMSLEEQSRRLTQFVIGNIIRTKEQKTHP